MTKQSDEPESPSSITQTMTNSPGGIQAGGNVTINQGAWLMSREQQIALTQALKSHAPATIQILMVGESDARRYAGQIAYALKDANWHFQLVNFALMMPANHGVYVLMSDPDLRNTVISALKTADIPFTLGTPNQPEYPNAILVAHKP